MRNPVAWFGVMVLLLFSNGRAWCAEAKPGAKEVPANATPAAAMSNVLAMCFGQQSMTRNFAEKAAQTGDKEVFAAALYNELHLAILRTNAAQAESALRQLQVDGDEFTVQWLERAATNNPARREELTAASERLRQRLAKDPRPAAGLVRARLLNAAVSDLTCSALEGPLKGFMWRWVETNASQPAVRAELTRLQAEPVKTNFDLTLPELIRNRANLYTTHLLAPPGKKP